MNDYEIFLDEVKNFLIHYREWDSVFDVVVEASIVARELSETMVETHWPHKKVLDLWKNKMVGIRQDDIAAKGVS